MKNKVLSLLMALCLVAGLAPMGIKANETADVWDGTADTSWYTGTETTYEIDSAEALAGLSKLAAEGNTFQGISLNLTTDVDLDNIEWTPIAMFMGNFNGNDHKVKNMYVALDSGQSGFFEYLQNAVVENLIIENANVNMLSTNSSFYQGVLAGWTQNSEIKNCGTSGVLKADVTASYVPCIGGFIGSAKGNSVLQNCWSTVKVTVVNEDLPAMVGGLIGQWENASNGAKIIDCYFGGMIEVANNTTSTSGIIGAALSFNGNVVLISGCVSYGTLIVPEEAAENALHIGALDEYGQVENCIWPDDGKTGVVRLVVDWSIGAATADPNFDENLCGHSVTLFSEDVIQELNAKAQTPDLWALGINGYPVYATQTSLIRADYSAVDAAKEKVPTDLSLYTDETVNTLNNLLTSIDENMSLDEQKEVDAMAQAIEDAITALEYKDADYTSVNEAVEKTNSLDKTLYKDFSGVEKSLAAVVSDLDITHQKEVDAMAKAIEDAINALEYKDADYTAVNDAIAKAEALDSDQYKDYTAVEEALASVVEGLDITHQKEVDAMAQAILDAISGLEVKPADTQTPSTSDHSSIILWIMVMIGAAMSLIGFVAYDYKKKYTH